MTYSHAHTHIHKHARAHAHTHTHARTHAHTHAHTYRETDRQTDRQRLVQKFAIDRLKVVAFKDLREPESDWQKKELGQWRTLLIDYKKRILDLHELQSRKGKKGKKGVGWETGTPLPPPPLPTTKHNKQTNTGARELIRVTEKNGSDGYCDLKSKKVTYALF